MKTIRTVIPLLLFTIISSSTVFTCAQTLIGSPGWQPFGAEDEEFVVLMPDVVQKKAFKERIQNYDCTMNTYIVLSKNGGSTFVLVSLGGLENYLRGIDNYRRLDLAKTTFTDIYLKRLNHGNEAITTIKENGPLHLGDLEGRVYNFKLNQQFGTAYIYCTPRKIYYAIALHTMPDDPYVRRFLASFSLPYQGRDANGYVPPMVLKYPITIPDGIGDGIGEGPDRDTGSIYSARQVAKKAQIIHKPAAEYTKGAISNKTAGTIQVLVVLGYSGQTKVLGVSKSLPDGLTEEAVRAALKIEFTPAEKDGQLVSQLATLVYTFSL